MIREYVKADLENTAKVWLRSGQDEYHYLPAFQELNENAAVDVFRRAIQDKCKLWVYESEGVICGFMAMDSNLVDRLYVDPSFQRSGVGSMLINYAKELYPKALVLKTHQQNKRACLFYEKHGFRAVDFGFSPSPESMPDVEYHWP